MLKKLHLKSLLLLACLALGVGSVWADDELFYTLDTNKVGNGANNSYDGNCDILCDDITWNLTGNSQQHPWRVGGKSLTKQDRTVYSKTPMGAAITKVNLTVGAASSITVNSLKLVVASDADFKTQLDEVSVKFAANSILTFTPTFGTEWAEGAYYKFIFNVTVTGSSNKFVEFVSATFYKSELNPDILPIATIGELSPTTLEFDTDGTFDLSITPADGVTENDYTVTWASSDDEMISVYDEGNYEVKEKAGKATITVTVSPTDEETYRAVSEEFEVLIVDPDDVKTNYYEKVTDVSELADDDIILIVYEKSSVAMGADAGNYRDKVDVTIVNGSIYNPNGAQEVRLEQDGDAFYLHAGHGYLTPESGQNYLKTQNKSDDAKAVISIADGNATITFPVQGKDSKNYELMYNNTNNPRFSCYIGTQQKVQIYKEVATTKVTVTAAGYATYCTPAAMDFSEDQSITAYTAAVEGDVVSFKKVEGTVPAGTGLLLKGTKGQQIDEDIAVVPYSTTDVTGNALKGVNEKTPIERTADGMTNYVLMNLAEGVGFYKVGAQGFNVGAKTAYLSVPEETAAAKGFFGVDDTTTGMDMPVVQPQTNETYNLQGQRVSDSYKGIVIVNGKKVINQ